MKKIKNDDMRAFLQKQPCKLTMAKHSLGIHQLRVMSRVIEQLQPIMSMEVDFLKKRDDLEVDVNVAELVISNNVKPLREALDGLMKKIVRIQHYVVNEDMSCETVEIGMPLVLKYKYKYGSKNVNLTLGKELIPQLIDLARGYTRYNIDVAFKTSSPNVFRLYQFVSQFRDKKQVQLNVSTLREWLMIEKKYSMPSKIKEWILEPAIKELKEKADVWFEIADRVMDGRKMVGWKFNIFTKKIKKEEPKQLNTASKASITSSKSNNMHNLQEDLAKQEERVEELKHQIKLKEYKQSLMSNYELSAMQVDKLVVWTNKGGNAAALNKELVAIKNSYQKGNIDNIGGYTAVRLNKKFNIGL